MVLSVWLIHSCCMVLAADVIHFVFFGALTKHGSCGISGALYINDSFIHLGSLSCIGSFGINGALRLFDSFCQCGAIVYDDSFLYHGTLRATGFIRSFWYCLPIRFILAAWYFRRV